MVEGKDKLVDALAIGPVAGEDNAPIVLATNELSSVQRNKLSAIVKQDTKVVQVGGGVSTNVIESLCNLIKLHLNIK